MCCFEDLRGKRPVNRPDREGALGTKHCGGVAFSTGNINRLFQPFLQCVWLINSTFNWNSLKPFKQTIKSAVQETSSSASVECRYYWLLEEITY